MPSTNSSQLFAMGLLALGVAVGPADANPANLKAMQDRYGPLLSLRLRGCDTCHASDKSAEPVFNASIGKPHNAYGARLMALVSEKPGGPKRDIADRLALAAGEDSDGDGVPNEMELLTDHHPGRKADRPTAVELKRVPELKRRLAQRLPSYRWRPFEVVSRPTLPKVRDVAWVRNPIDAFVAAERERAGLKPRPEAPKETILRRVYLDLIGLPPTPTELTAFLADRSPNAYEKVVDHLLARPQYGERWGRHWMDVWRYSDWDGYKAEVRNSQPHIWRWRDWIVRSLNEDKPYDRMVHEMLAGDELAPGDSDVLPATGFLVRNWYKFSRHETLTKLIEHTGKAFLGVTLNCARCHDHKFDAISMKEYYNFRAVFEPFDIRQDRVPGEMSLERDGLSRAFDAEPGAETFMFLMGDDRKPDKTQKAHPSTPSLLGGPAFKPAPVRLPMSEQAPDRRPFVLDQLQRDARAAVLAARTDETTARETGDARGVASAESRTAAAEASEGALLALLEVERLEADGKKNTPEWKTAAERNVELQRKSAVVAADAELAAAEFALQRASEPAAAKQRAAATTRRDNARKALEAARLALAKPLDANYTGRGLKIYPGESTGRRLALARWITDRTNPLAARVAANHMWLRHFGSALVPSTFDFGRAGRTPTNPALLDWLASELMDGSRWKMKSLHRLIVTSSAYRMDTTSDPAALAKDPENRLLWRMNSRRLEAESVRDSLLSIAGKLDLTQGGAEYDQDDALTRPRRSIYFRQSMEKNVEFLQIFDQANVAECYERAESIVPQQALALANSPLSIAMSRTLAAKLWDEVGRSDHAAERFIDTAFVSILNRAASAAERRECARFLREQGSRLTDTARLTPIESGAPAPVKASIDPAQRARESLIHVLFNHNDFVTVR